MTLGFKRRIEESHSRSIIAMVQERGWTRLVEDQVEAGQGVCTRNVTCGAEKCPKDVTEEKHQLNAERPVKILMQRKLLRSTGIVKD